MMSRFFLFKKHKKAWAKYLDYIAYLRPYAAPNIDNYVSSFSIQSMLGWYILFFEENGIYISTSSFFTTNSGVIFDYRIRQREKEDITIQDFKFRPECWMSMIEQAFEILEETL